MEKKLARQILKFGVVGGTAFLIDYIVMICLTEVLDLNYLISFPFYIGFIILLRSYILLILYYLSFFGAIPARAMREAVQ